MDSGALSRIDSFPYRHSISEIMSQPVLSGEAHLTLLQACEAMYERGASSIVVVDRQGRTIGIVTEHDLLRVIARSRESSQTQTLALTQTLDSLMTAPVKTVTADALLHVALGRMARLNLRHLVVTDSDNRPIGMVTGSQLLKVRAGDSLAIGDAIDTARTAAELGRAKAMLPILARGLLNEEVPARTIAAIIASVIRDMTARAGELAVESLHADGWGEAPGHWCLLVLGSGGRGESLLSFDQDNAIVHDGTDGNEPWLAELGKRLADLLNEAGLPYCDGGVMAQNAPWRHSLDEWRREILGWVLQPKEHSVLNTDIFFDFQAVLGDTSLAEDLRTLALDSACESAFFLQFLALEAARTEVPLGLFGDFQTQDGKLNAKKHGLLPLVCAARAKAVRNKVRATGTIERYARLAEMTLVHPDDLAALTDAHEVILAVMLDQQLRDIEAGQKPTALIEPKSLRPAQKDHLREAFKRVKLVKTMVTGLSGVA